jgi:hypothetical protein
VLPLHDELPEEEGGEETPDEELEDGREETEEEKEK